MTETTTAIYNAIKIYPLCKTCFDVCKLNLEHFEFIAKKNEIEFDDCNITDMLCNCGETLDTNGYKIMIHKLYKCKVDITPKYPNKRFTIKCKNPTSKEEYYDLKEIMIQTDDRYSYNMECRKMRIHVSKL